jgi:3-oxoacyl-(acyl-carrier-protein) synthase
MADALATAGLKSGQIGAVLCGANGCPGCDARQAAALARLLGGLPVPVWPLKDWTGEVFGAFGAVAVAVAALALARQGLPARGARSTAPLETVLIYDSGWDGNHAAMVLQRFPKGEPTNGSV